MVSTAGLTELDLMSGNGKNRQATIFGSRAKNILTINSGQSVHPGRELSIKIPKLQANRAIIPGTLNLIYDFNVTGTKSYFRNNLANLLVSRLVVQVGGVVIYDNTHESIFRMYETLWKGKTWRENAIEYGIANLNTRKLISGEDTAEGTDVGDTDAQKADALVYGIYGKRQKISLNMILEDNGLLATGQMEDDIIFTFHLPSSAEVLKTQDGQAAGAYSLSNLSLEYDTLEEEAAVSAAAQKYANGLNWFFPSAVREGRIPIAVGATHFSLEIKKPRKLGRYVIILFKRDAGPQDDSEEYLYPNIKSVKVSHLGQSTVLYEGEGGLGKTYLFEEVKRIMHAGETRPDQNVSIREFYKDKFACAIDMRTVPEWGLVGNGKQVSGTQSGVSMEITLDPATTVAVVAHPFLVSDGIVGFANSSITSFEQ